MHEDTISSFIHEHLEVILTDFEDFAGQMIEHDEAMSPAELRNGAEEILRAIADDVETSRSRTEQHRKSRGELDESESPIQHSARRHATDRLVQKFTLHQLAAEYRALRSSVMRRWMDAFSGQRQPPPLIEIIRFNEAVDESLTAALDWYRSRMEQVEAENVALVTDRIAAEEALRDAARAKDEFLAILSHELRNPLAPLRSALDLLEQAPSAPDLLDDVLPMMNRQLSHLVRLVNDLLDISRISRGALEIQPTHIDLGAAVDAAIEQTEALIERMGHELVLQRSETALTVHGDFERLVQVFANLVANAARYTPDGGRIEVLSGNEGGEAVVRVRDNGYGIPPGRIGTLFQLFSQIPEHRARSAGGLGVGLALSRQLIEMHGGSIDAESEGTDQGSEFIVRLPLSGNAEPATETEGGSTIPRRSWRVLVVDDNADAAEGLRMLLELQGHAASAAHDGPSALSEIERFQPDVVLLDLGMPQMDGFEVARRARNLPAGEKTFFVAVTGWGQDEDRALTRESGFFDHLTKPIEGQQISALFDRLRDHLS